MWLYLKIGFYSVVHKMPCKDNELFVRTRSKEDIDKLQKLLWYIYNEPKAIPEPDEATQAIFDQGHLIGDYSKKLFPTGV